MTLAVITCNVAKKKTTQNKTKTNTIIQGVIQGDTNKQQKRKEVIEVTNLVSSSVKHILINALKASVPWFHDSFCLLGSINRTGQKSVHGNKDGFEKEGLAFRLKTDRSSLEHKDRDNSKLQGLYARRDVDFFPNIIAKTEEGRGRNLTSVFRLGFGLTKKVLIKIKKKGLAILNYDS